MNQFDYTQSLPKLLTPEIVNAVSMIHEYRGRQARLSHMIPEVLQHLVEIAKIQSVGASNRIEGIQTSDERLRQLVEGDITPKNRSEREILGYRYVLDLIHTYHAGMSVTPNVILQLHRDLYRYLDVSIAGHWKDSDNIIQERLADGTARTRFVPTSAAMTPFAMESLCAEYQQQIDTGRYDPLVVVAQFVFDFVSIHPFSDGNGRMSRLLTLLLLYRQGYEVGKYISIEHEIEQTKRTYYEVLRSSSVGWETGTYDCAPFVEYLLGVILACYRDFDERAMLADTVLTDQERVSMVLSSSFADMSKRELQEKLPSMSEQKLARILQALQGEGYVEKIGSARLTRYRWIR